MLVLTYLGDSNLSVFSPFFGREIQTRQISYVFRLCREKKGKRSEWKLYLRRDLRHPNGQSKMSRMKAMAAVLVLNQELKATNQVLTKNRIPIKLMQRTIVLYCSYFSFIRCINFTRGSVKRAGLKTYTQPLYQVWFHQSIRKERKNWEPMITSLERDTLGG